MADIETNQHSRNKTKQATTPFPCFFTTLTNYINKFCLYTHLYAITTLIKTNITIIHNNNNNKVPNLPF